MPNPTAPVSLWDQPEIRQPRSGGLFNARCADHASANKSPIARRQDRVRAIWVNAALWTFQGWLAMFYAGASLAKLTAPPAHLEILLGWSQYVPQNFVTAVGVTEAALALGMLVPVIGWKIGHPVLTASALGLLLIQFAVTGYHLLSADVGNVVVNLLLMGMTVSILMFKCARQPH